MLSSNTIRFLSASVVVIALWICPLLIQAADEFDKPPISYRDSSGDNCVTQLQQKLDSGKHAIVYDEEFGYLKSLLNALDVPAESQMLVFSKTSFQLRRIAPATPRAVYFSDDVYIGFCQAGDVLEITAVDPQLGAVFYSLDQEEVATPQLVRRNDNCMVCHASSRTGGVPGHVVRSLFVDAEGHPMYSAGSRMVDHTTPFAERWGGWYVTGSHGQQSHLGNLIIRTRRVVEPVDNTEGQNLQDLRGRFDVERYVTPDSDIVALMVMEHQTMVHNRLTKANYAARQAIEYEMTMNKVMGNKDGHRLESTNRRIQDAGNDLVDALLLVDEAPLASAISGTSGYAEVFSELGVKDRQGRSLRDLDLTKRMFRYPCSYLIYSESFDGLPQLMKDYVWQRMWNVLCGKDQSDRFAHLSGDDRLAIAEILEATRAELPNYWQTAPGLSISPISP